MSSLRTMGLGLALLAFATGAQASTTDWTTWQTATAGQTAGTASGTMGSTTVTYTGELRSLVANYPSWTPSSTFSGGTVSNAPPQSGGIIQLFGNTGATDTISFSTAVVDPVLAIWSLGQSGDTASFNFTSAEPFTIVAGGPSAEYSGSTITASGNNVYGTEGNGIVQFHGTFTSLSWTNPTFENWYGFTVGTSGGVSTVPVPASLSLSLGGLALLAGLRRRRSRS